jgi:serine/threonine protein kinase
LSNDRHDDDKTQSFIALSEGTSVGHYGIIFKIGSGSRGEVYPAEDLKSDRRVALKFFPSHLCQNEDCRARVKCEAKAAAEAVHLESSSE